jgi:diguanylate cyclase (GGDEF)-like protein/PAS domain S-box-containing protein
MQSDKKVLSVLQLILNYEDKQNYNNSVFNSEKESLLEHVKHYFEKDDNALIEFFDSNNNLVAVKSFSDIPFQSGFVAYENGVAVFKTKGEKKTLKHSKNYKKDCVDNNINYKYKDGYYTICQVKEIAENERTLGFIKITYYLNQKDLNKLNENLIYPVSFILNTKKQDYIYTQLDQVTGVYLSHDIDMSHINETQKDFIVNMFVAILTMIILIAFVFHMFITKEILNPLSNLRTALESMLSKKYHPIKIKNYDEIGQIFETSNKIFHQFWESYSSLSGYKRSVETSNLVTSTDLKGNITYANDLFCKTSEYKQNEVIGKPHNIVRHPDMQKNVFKYMWKSISKGDTWRGVIKNRTKSGGFYWADAVISPVYSSDEEIEGYISIRRDITELMKNKEELEFRANYDLLTNLRSRDKLHVDLKNTTTPALTLINIDRFSQINDFYGHSFGDTLLVQFSLSLQKKFDTQCIEKFTLYRYGGDEFAILIENYEKDKLVLRVSQILQELESNSIVIEGKELNLNLSCGISFEHSSKALLSADMALKIAKKEQKALVVYSKENSLDKLYENNLLWAAKLKKAIEENRVVPFFQPIVNNKSLVFEKYEALVRIVEPNDKVVSPFFFLDIAKQTKQYLEITRVMVEKSFEVFKDRDEDFSINLTMEDISNAKMREFLFEKFDNYPDIANRLVLELVESESVGDYNEVIEFINIAKSKGCKVAIDDFGSGYSNFEYLVKLQADFIKIDGSLIKHINTQKESYVVVSTIVSFAKEMGIKTIAEFIEDEEILKTVQELGIDFSQGYHFSAPKREV